MSFFKSFQFSIRTFFLLAFIFLVNVLLIYPLFTGDYTQHVGSIESAFITDARFIDSYGFSNWNPLWYCGFPFHLSYTPLLPDLMVVTHWLIPAISIPQSYRIITALAYAFSPVTLFLFVKYLTRRDLTAISVAIIYSVALTYAHSAIPLGVEIVDFKFVPYSLAALIYFGEGPHILGLTIIPLAALALMRSLRSPSFKQYVLTSVAIAAVALTNLIALFALVLISVVILFSETLRGDVIRKMRTTLICGTISYGLVAFCYDLSFLKASIYFGVLGEHPLTWQSLVLMVAIFAAVLSILYISSKGRPESQQLFIASSWTIMFLIIIATGYFFKVPLAPQSGRYVPEFNVGLSIFLGVAATPILEKFVSVLLKRGKPMWKPLTFAAIVITVIALPLAKSTWGATYPNHDLESTPEYNVAKWLEDHTYGNRVYATGTICFWLNVFTNVPQLRGGSDQGSTNPWWSDASIELNSGSDGNLSNLWLKVLNIKYIVVNYLNADTPYHDYVFPDKFENLLPLRYTYMGFGVFEVPLIHPELIQPVDVTRQDLTINGISDIGGLRKYIEAVEETLPVACSYRFDGTDNIVVAVGNASESTGILVKMTFDDRWRAYVEGVEVAITNVGPNFMLINPVKRGNYELKLSCEKNESEVAGIGISIVTLSLLLAFSVYKFSEKSRKLHRYW